MKIEMAINSGFCMGVRKAILKIVEELNSSDENIYMYGPLIHNPQTIEVLKNRGLITIDSLDELNGKQIAIRTHGIPVDENNRIRKSALRTINLTCSRVARVQSIIKKYSSEGYYTIIIGDKDHAEVTGLKSYARSGVCIISEINDIINIPDADKYIIVSQTTHERSQFEQLVKEISVKFNNVYVIDTICDSTRLRQDDVKNGIKKGIDTLVVVGGKNSANTSRLVKIGIDNGIKSFHVETDSELNSDNFKNSKYVLVTAGASTPGWIINNVLEKIYIIKNERSNFFVKNLSRYLELLVRSNIISSIGSLFMVLLVQLYADIKPDIRYGIISALYIFVMYSVNNYLDRDFLIKSNSYKYKIYEKHGLKLLIAAIISFISSLYLALNISLSVFILLIIPYIFGMFYSTDQVKCFVLNTKFSLFKKFYNAKIVTAFGWLFPVVIIPLYGFDVSWMIYLSAGLYFYIFVFIRQLIIDFIAFQGDLILGRDTLPTWFGVKKIIIASYILTATVIIIFTSISLLLEMNIFLALLLSIFYYIILLKNIQKKDYLISLRYEFLTDFNFFILAAIYFLIKIL